MVQELEQIIDTEFGLKETNINQISDKNFMLNNENADPTTTDLRRNKVIFSVKKNQESGITKSKKENRVSNISHPNKQ